MKYVKELMLILAYYWKSQKDVNLTLNFLTNLSPKTFLLPGGKDAGDKKSLKKGLHFYKLCLYKFVLCQIHAFLRC